MEIYRIITITVLIILTTAILIISISSPQPSPPPPPPSSIPKRPNAPPARRNCQVFYDGCNTIYFFDKYQHDGQQTTLYCSQRGESKCLEYFPID